MLTYADFAIIVIVFVSVAISLSRGFLREALSLLTWGFAFWIALSFNKQLATVLAPYIATPSLRTIASFAILLIITFVIGGLFGFLLSSVVSSTGLSSTDRTLGMVFGLARGILFVGIALLLLSLTAFTQDSWWKNSLLIPHFQPLIVWLKSFLSDKLAQVSDFVTHVPSISIPTPFKDM